MAGAALIVGRDNRLGMQNREIRGGRGSVDRGACAFIHPNARAFGLPKTFPNGCRAACILPPMIGVYLPALFAAIPLIPPRREEDGIPLAAGIVTRTLRAGPPGCLQREEIQRGRQPAFRDEPDSAMPARGE